MNYLPDQIAAAVLEMGGADTYQIKSRFPGVNEKSFRGALTAAREKGTIRLVRAGGRGRGVKVPAVWAPGEVSHWRTKIVIPRASCVWQLATGGLQMAWPPKWQGGRVYVPLGEWV